MCTSTHIWPLALYYTRIEVARQRWTAPSAELFAEGDTEYASLIRDNGARVIALAQAYISDAEFTSALLDPDASGPFDNSKEANPT
jgi:hypothetical protein